MTTPTRSTASEDPEQGPDELFSQKINKVRPGDRQSLDQEAFLSEEHCPQGIEHMRYYKPESFWGAIQAMLGASLFTFLGDHVRQLFALRMPARDMYSGGKLGNESCGMVHRLVIEGNECFDR